jgi:DNA-binding TFAR19-related protein (PDSD5 family)
VQKEERSWIVLPKSASEMNEEEEIKKKRQETKKIQEQLKSALRAALTEDAYDRIMNVSVANNDMYLMAAKNALMLYKRMGRRIGDVELLALLRAIKGQTEKETKITFHKK